MATSEFHLDPTTFPYTVRHTHRHSVTVYRKRNLIARDIVRLNYWSGLLFSAGSLLVGLIS